VIISKESWSVLYCAIVTVNPYTRTGSLVRCRSLGNTSSHVSKFRHKMHQPCKLQVSSLSCMSSCFVKCYLTARWCWSVVGMTSIVCRSNQYLACCCLQGTQVKSQASLPTWLALWVLWDSCRHSRVVLANALGILTVAFLYLPISRAAHEYLADVEIIPWRMHHSSYLQAPCIVMSYIIQLETTCTEEQQPEWVC